MVFSWWFYMLEFMFICVFLDMFILKTLFCLHVKKLNTKMKLSYYHKRSYYIIYPWIKIWPKCMYSKKNIVEDKIKIDN